MPSVSRPVIDGQVRLFTAWPDIQVTSQNGGGEKGLSALANSGVKGQASDVERAFTV
jgi:hypothetical protein